MDGEGDTSIKELFISYGREPDVNEFAAKLKQDLETNGFSVWLDTDDISIGSSVDGAIGTGLQNCRGIIPIITSKYIASKFCTKELSAAHGKDKLIFPIMYQDDLDFSSSERALGVEFVISSINYLRPNIDDYKTNLQKLVTGMKLKGIGCTTDSDTISIASAASHDSTSPAPVIGPRSEIAVFDSGVKLSVVNRGKLYEVAFDARMHWKDIGASLGIKDCDLGAIEMNEHYKVESCFREMLIKWLQGGATNKNVGAFREALEANNLFDVSEKVKEAFCRS